MSEVMVDLWANFATFHDPTPIRKDGTGGFVGDALANLKEPWKKASKIGGSSSNNYYRFKDGEILGGGDPDLDRRLQFWRDVVNKERVLYR